MAFPYGHRPRVALLPFLVALIALAWFIYRFNWLIDDAFINFRYSRHLAEGHGLRFNVGEDPPVEGFSNLLWVLILAPFEMLGPVAPTVSRILSVACAAILLWRFTRFVNRHVGLPLPFSLLPPLLLATWPPIGAWATSGLETLPFALLAFLAYEFTVVTPNVLRGVAGSLTCALLILMRADGIVWVGIVLGVACVETARKHDRGAARNLVITTAAAAGVLALLTLFRLVYFGWPLPNTFYAKVDFGMTTLHRGVSYVLRFLLFFPHTLAVGAGAIVLARQDGRLRRLAQQAAAIGVCWCGYVVIVGADWMPMARFMVVVLPFISILFAVVLDRLVKRPRALLCVAAASITLCVLPAYNVCLTPSVVVNPFNPVGPEGKRLSPYERWETQRNYTTRFCAIGRALGKHTKPGQSLICASIGAVSYYSRLYIYDCVGLVTSEVAHRKAPPSGSWSNVFKSVHPTYFLKYRPTHYWASLVQLAERKQFEAGRWHRLPGDLEPSGLWPPVVRALYEPVIFPLDRSEWDGPRMSLMLLMRRDLLEAENAPSSLDRLTARQQSE